MDIIRGLLSVDPGGGEMDVRYDVHEASMKIRPHDGDFYIFLIFFCP